MRGVADILGIWNGRPLAIEVKTPTGKVSPHQKAFLDEWRKAGGIGFVARSWEDCVKELDKADELVYGPAGKDK
jgi:penicillin-binding protein-related factor A (putative recombinase)